MSELKTLNDLDKDWTRGDGYLEPEIREYKSQIKQEAIKRVKLWEIQKRRFKEIGNEAGVNCVEMIQKEYLDFFNITEKDLLDAVVSRGEKK